MNSDAKYNSVRGSYHDPCEKIAYATKALAEAALRNCQRLGRGEKSAYRCPKCRMHHLTRQSPESAYEKQEVGTVDNGSQKVSVARIVQRGEASLSLRIERNERERKSYQVTHLDRARATELLDVLIQALYGGSESQDGDPQSERMSVCPAESGGMQ